MERLSYLQANVLVEISDGTQIYRNEPPPAHIAKGAITDLLDAGLLRWSHINKTKQILRVTMRGQEQLDAAREIVLGAEGKA